MTRSDGIRRCELERITIIGLGPVGLSIGLALKKARLKNTEIIGSAGDRNLVSTSEKMGAVDKGIPNLKSALEGAQMIILDTPLSEVRELLNAIGPIVEDGAVITDTGTSKVPVMNWANQFLPKDVSYVGGHPLIKQPLKNLEDADPSVLQGINYCVMAPSGADDQSVKTVVGLIETVGARPLFLDAHEHDSYSVAMNHLPLVMSSALVTAAAGSDSWREMHRLAASDFADFSRHANNDPEHNEVACLANPEALVYWIDELIRELYDYRNLVKDKSDELLDKFITAWEERAKWEAGAVTPTSESALPSARESMASAFFGERAVKRYQQMTGKDKKNPLKYERKIG
jgi:prephenate dehydrogenase